MQAKIEDIDIPSDFIPVGTPKVRVPPPEKNPKAMKEMPASRDAEEALLSCIVLEPGETMKLCKGAGLEAGMFYHTETRTLYAAIEDLHEQGRSIDEITIIERLESGVFLNDVGGFPGMNRILERVEMAHGASDYIETVVEKATRRELIRWAAGIAEDAYKRPMEELIRGHESFSRTLASRRLYADPDRLPVPVVYADIPQEAFNLPPILIDGVLRRGGKIMFSAPSKARKTWTMLHMAICIQGGHEWMGFPTKKTNVLIVDCELFESEMNNRIRLISNSSGIDDIDGIHTWSLRGYVLSLPKIKESIIEYCTKNDIGFISVDPYYRLGAEDENDAGKIARFLAGFEEIARRTGAAMALTHHFAKGNSAEKSSIDRASGSGVFARDPDAILTMTEIDGSTEEDPIFAIEASLRSFAPVKAFGIRWDFPLWIRDDNIVVDLKGADKKRGRPTIFEPSDLLKILGNSTLKAGEWQQLCADEQGMPRRTFYEMKKTLLDTGRIESTNDGFSARNTTAENDFPHWSNPDEEPF